MNVRTSKLSDTSGIKIAVIFLATIGAGITFLLNPVSHVVQDPLEKFLAIFTGTVLSWFNSTVQVYDSTIVIEAFVANIVPACTGLFTTTIYIAAVLAYPCSLKRKLQGVVFGVIAIMLVNAIRIISLLVIGAYWIDAFDFAHLVIWQTVAVVFAVFLWLFWIQRFAHEK